MLLLLLVAVSAVASQEDVCLDVRTDFSTLLLLVQWNYGHYGALESFHRIWDDVFPNQLHVGRSDEKLPPLAHGRLRGHVRNEECSVSDVAGWFSYANVACAIDANPDYQQPGKGYMFMNDDVFLAAPRLQVLTRNWTTVLIEDLQEPSLFHPRTHQQPLILNVDDSESAEAWSWARHETVGIKAVRRVLADPAFRPFMKRMGNTKTWLARPWGADSYFIPGPQAGTFSTLAKIMARHRVFLEIAVPTIFLRILRQPTAFGALVAHESGTDMDLFEVFDPSRHVFAHSIKLDDHRHHRNRTHMQRSMLARCGFSCV